jgi:hypothetical protein
MAWIFNPFTGSLDFVGQGASGSPPSGGEADTVTTIEQNFFVEIRQLTLVEATNKELTLVNNPAANNKVTFDLIGGPPQSDPDDFEVTGDLVSWNGKTLETVLEAGDKIRLIYII